MKIKAGFSQKTLCHFKPNFVCKFYRYKEMKICCHDAGHMIKMAAMPSKIFSGTSGKSEKQWIFQKLLQSVT